MAAGNALVFSLTCKTVHGGRAFWGRLMEHDYGSLYQSFREIAFHNTLERGSEPLSRRIVYTKAYSIQ